MKKIAVIIPNYNGFKYSKKCLKALENQTFKDFTVCIVDDCSTDSSYEQFKKYAQMTQMDMKIIRTDKNRGPGYARKLGLEKTQSKWVAFCDIDDYYDNNFLEEQLKNATDSQSDLVMCDHNYANTTDIKKANVMNWAKEVHPSKNTVLAYAKMSLWRLLVKRSLFDGIIIPELYYGEDGPVVIQLILNSKKIYVDIQAHYNYYLRNGSASNSTNTKMIEDYLEAWRIIENKTKNKYWQECEYIGINMILYGLTLIMFKNKGNIEKIKTVIVEFEQKFPRWYKNKYLKHMDIKKLLYLSSIKFGLLNLNNIYAQLHRYLINKTS